MRFNCIYITGIPASEHFGDRDKGYYRGYRSGQCKSTNSMHHVKNVLTKKTSGQDKRNEQGHDGRTRNVKRDSSKEKRGEKMLYVI